MTTTTSFAPLNRRHALGVLGGSLGATAIAQVTSGFLSPAAAARTAPLVTATLDKKSYEAGEPMTLTVTENVTRAQRREIAVSDSTGARWTKLSDNGRVPVFTAVAGSARAGTHTVTVTLKRLGDRVTVSADAAYLLGNTWRERFAGDREGRVMMGMAVTGKANSNLQWEQAVALLGASAKNVSVRRCFVPGWITKQQVNHWADWAESAGVYPVMSFKVPGNNWAGVVAGKYDADLDLLCATLDARAKAGRAPVCVAVHHEPSGDGDLAVWARMQEYLSNRFAPWNKVFCFSAISNGFDWGPHRGARGEVEAMYPASLIAALNRNKHIVACDTYDSGDPTKLDYAQFDRTSLKMSGFISWARSQGVERIGIGEFGCHDAIDILKCWALIDANRDLFAYACYFNSGQNSRADWRLVPATHPPDPAVTSYNDRGGSIDSANRLSAGKQMFVACAQSQTEPSRRSRRARQVRRRRIRRARREERMQAATAG